MLCGGGGARKPIFPTPPLLGRRDGRGGLGRGCPTCRTGGVRSAWQHAYEQGQNRASSLLRARERLRLGARAGRHRGLENAASLLSVRRGCKHHLLELGMRVDGRHGGGVNPTSMAQNHTHVALIILTTQTWRGGGGGGGYWWKKNFRAKTRGPAPSAPTSVLTQNNGPDTEPRFSNLPPLLRRESMAPPAQRFSGRRARVPP